MTDGSGGCVAFGAGVLTASGALIKAAMVSGFAGVCGFAAVIFDVSGGIDAVVSLAESEAKVTTGGAIVAGDGRAGGNGTSAASIMSSAGRRGGVGSTVPNGDGFSSAAAVSISAGLLRAGAARVAACCGAGAAGAAAATGAGAGVPRTP